MPMKVKAIADFFSPGRKGFEAGKEYDVTEAFGETLVNRQLAEKIEERKKTEAKQTAKK